jgi:ribokinase
MASPSPKIITVIGSLNIDLVTTTNQLPRGGETLKAESFSTGSGGKGANQAVACARLSRSKPGSKAGDGLQSDIIVKMIGAVGDDEFGPKLIDGMKADGIDTSGIKVVSGVSTGVAVIIVETIEKGENRIMLAPGANDTLKPQDFMTKESLGTPLPDLIILQFEIPFDTVMQILKIAKEAGVAVLLNPAPAYPIVESTYGSISHLIVNETEAITLSRKTAVDLEFAGGFDFALSEFIKWGAENVVITLGSKGATFKHNQ